MLKHFHKHIPGHIQFIFLTYLGGIVLFTLNRFLLMALNIPQLKGIPLPTLITAYWMGWRFDTVISGYILALPLLIASLVSLTKLNPSLLKTFLRWFLLVLYALAFFICGIDIPYFNHFNSRLSAAILNWTNTPGFMVKLVLQDIRYYPFLLLFIAELLLFHLLLKIFLRRSWSVSGNRVPRFQNVVISLLSMALLFLGIRGRVAAKSPIRWGTAFFSPYPFANQLGLNPVFTFGQSWLDTLNRKKRVLHLMDDRQAIRQVRRSLNLSSEDSLYSPIARQIRPPGKPRRLNVILVLMESMSAMKMGHFGNPDSLTPHLDSLAERSYCFHNIFSAGIHTYNGIFASLYGFPALITNHPMKGVESMQAFRGIAQILGDQGYQTIYICTHDEQFDNMAGFLTANGFQEIVSQKDYPSEKILSTLGVPDHVMFEESIPHLNRMYQNQKPFFATYLTASDHGPYIIPEGIPFTPHSREIRNQIVEYVDWSIDHFLKLCQTQPWFDSTLFVFTGDHGALINPVYDMDLSYHHIPLILYSPALNMRHKKFEQIGGQIDIFPTILHILNVPYLNNTLGIDLFAQRRPFIFFSADEKLGVLNDSLYLIIRPGGNLSLYKYRQRNLTDLSKRYPAMVTEMRAYAFSMLQTTQWLIRNRKVY